MLGAALLSRAKLLGELTGLHLLFQMDIENIDPHSSAHGLTP